MTTSTANLGEPALLLAFLGTLAIALLVLACFIVWVFRHPEKAVRAAVAGVIEAADPWALEAASPEDFRRAGWMVAVHNDYMIRGKFGTFWLFTKGDRCVKGEGASDAEALEWARPFAGLETYTR